MSPLELATKIYNHVTSLNRSREQWDEWDDKREIEFIKNLIVDNEHKPVREHKRFTDEWGNSDWRDTGEMKG
jgi:hypothetical protein